MMPGAGLQIGQGNARLRPAKRFERRGGAS